MCVEGGTGKEKIIKIKLRYIQKVIRGEIWDLQGNENLVHRVSGLTQCNFVDGYNVSKGYAASIFRIYKDHFYLQNIGSKHFRNFRVHLSNYTALHLKRQYYY